MPSSIRRVTVSAGVGGYWVNDQAAFQRGAQRDGFFFSGAPVTPGFGASREPSTAFCISLELADGQFAYGDCVTVFNAGAAGRPAPLRAEDLPAIAQALATAFDGKSFSGFREAAGALSPPAPP